jgi:hypothetical protein
MTKLSLIEGHAINDAGSGSRLRHYPPWRLRKSRVRNANGVSGMFG